MKTQKGWTMKTNVLLSLSMFALLNVLLFPGVAAMLAGTPGRAAARGRNAQADDALNQPRFRVRSNTFQNNTVIPSSMVFNGTLGSVCTGTNTSPDLEWTPSLPWTKSYAVVVYDVLEHVVDPAQMLRASRRVLGSDGRLVSFTPLEDQPLSFYRMYRRLLGDDLYVETKEHLQAFSARSLRLLLEDSFIVEMNIGRWTASQKFRCCGAAKREMHGLVISA